MEIEQVKGFARDSFIFRLWESKYMFGFSLTLVHLSILNSYTFLSYLWGNNMQHAYSYL